MHDDLKIFLKLYDNYENKKKNLIIHVEIIKFLM